MYTSTLVPVQGTDGCRALQSLGRPNGEHGARTYNRVLGAHRHSPSGVKGQRPWSGDQVAAERLLHYHNLRSRPICLETCLFRTKKFRRMLGGMDPPVVGLPPTRTRQDCKQFCLVSTQFPISKVSVVLNVFETEQLQIGNWVETVLSCRQFCSHRRHGQDKTSVQFVLSVSTV